MASEPNIEEAEQEQTLVSRAVDGDDDKDHDDDDDDDEEDDD